MSDALAQGIIEYVDLHSHTNESDGNLTPAELVGLAVNTGLAALAITDHDTFSGYELALPVAQAAGLTLIRGIELNSRLNLQSSGGTRAAHMLAYFPSLEPGPEFLNWLTKQRAERKERNRKLARALQNRGLEITLEEVEARGRSLAGRTHFAQLLVEKGYVSHFEEAFEKYLGENAATHVERQSQTTEETIEHVRAGGGVPVVAHPIRLGLDRESERRELTRLRAAGLLGLEIYHSDHPPELQAHYRQLAEDLELIPTGGSDYHGAVKRQIELGTGLRGNVRVPKAFLDGLRAVQTQHTRPVQ